MLKQWVGAALFILTLSSVTQAGERNLIYKARVHGIPRASHLSFHWDSVASNIVIVEGWHVFAVKQINGISPATWTGFNSNGDRIELRLQKGQDGVVSTVSGRLKAEFEAFTFIGTITYPRN